MRDHTKLRAFELADKIAVLIYQITRKFPRDEMYGLTSQMRRAAVSVPSNIVEGCARESQAEYLRFLEIAYGSLKELQYQFSLACSLGYPDKQDIPNCEAQLLEAIRVLNALLRSMRNPNRRHTYSLQPTA